MAKTVKDLDSKVNDLKNYFTQELGKFRGEIEKVKTPTDDSASNKQGVDTEDIRVKFDFFKATVENQLKNLESEIRQLRKEHAAVHYHLDNYIQQSNKVKILVLGIPETVEDTDLLKHTVSVFNSILMLPLSDKDVYDCYRLGKKIAGKPRPVLVQFTVVETRNELLRCKRRLKGSKLVITEVLSPMRFEVFKLARQKFQKNCWSNNGNIGFKVGETVKYVSNMKQFLDSTAGSVECTLDGASNTKSQK